MNQNTKEEPDWVKDLANKTPKTVTHLAVNGNKHITYIPKKNAANFFKVIKVWLSIK